MKISSMKLILAYIVSRYNNWLVSSILERGDYFLLNFVIRKKERINFLCGYCGGLILRQKDFKLYGLKYVCKNCRAYYSDKEIKEDFRIIIGGYLNKFITKKRV